MRIAVLIYGRLDRYAEHYDNIVESIGTQHTLDFFLSSDNAPEEVLNDFIRLYAPIDYTNSPIHYDYDLSKYPKQPRNGKIHNMACHFINKNRVFALVETYIRTHDIHYDCVMSLRIDCVFQSRFVFTTVEDNTIYIPRGNDYNGINDQLAYGKVDVMKKYNSIDPVYLLDNNLSIPHPETLTRANIRLHNLAVKRPLIHYCLYKNLGKLRKPAPPLVSLAQPVDMTPPPVDMIPPPPVKMAPPPVDMAPQPVEMAPQPVEMAPPPVKMDPPQVKMAPPLVKTAQSQVKMAPPPVKTAQSQVKMAPPPVKMVIPTPLVRNVAQLRAYFLHRR
jgi:hypothetical protein